MKKFSYNCKFTLANYDCPNLKKYFKANSWFSIKEIKNISFAALPTSINGQNTIANIYEEEQLIDQIKLPIPGLHNLSNFIGAIAACRVAGIPYEIIKNGFSKLKAPLRRFEFRGTWEGRQIVDDYAHHPSEIEATIKMAKLMILSKKSVLPFPANRLVVAFQPHRYSRTRQFLNELAEALSEADCVLLAPVYAAGETAIDNADNQALAKCLRSKYPNTPTFTCSDINNLSNLIKIKSIKNDLILILGAGDINKTWTLLNQDITIKK